MASFVANAAIGGPLLVMSIALVISVALFVIALQIGGADKGWPQLE